MDDMASKCPNFQKKLGWLLTGRVQAEVAREATALGGSKITPQALNSYVNGTAPPPDVALRLAEVLNVDLAWLIDEKQEVAVDKKKGIVGPFPAPGESYLRFIDDRLLVEEVRHRYVSVAEKVSKLIDEAEKIDWDYIAKALAAADSIEHAPPDIVAGVEVARELGVLVDSALRRFDVGYFSSPTNVELSVPNQYGNSLNGFYLGQRVSRILATVIGSQGNSGAFRVCMKFINQRAFLAEPDARIAATRKALDQYRKSKGKYRKSS